MEYGAVWHQIIRDAVMLFVVIDPIGTLSLFLGVTSHTTPEQRRKIALRCCLYSAVVLVGCIIFGEILLLALGIRLVSFQIAGGIVLFLFGLQMVFGAGVANPPSEGEPSEDVAIFPLSIPSIASPGAIMAVVLLTANDRHIMAEQAITTVILLVILGITYVMLLGANRIQRVIGRGGANILIRVMGLILCALAVETVGDGAVKIFVQMRPM